MHSNIAAALALAWVFTSACTESKQTGAPTVQKKQPVTEDPPFEEPLGDPPDEGNDDTSTPDCDPDKDFHKLDFPQEIKDCHKDEKMYNFDAKKCTTMWTSAFDCDYKSVRAVLKDLELSDADLKEQENAGLNLIGCGQSNNGFTIVTQHWQKAKDASKKDCSYDKQGKVVSVCFKKYTDTTPPSTPSGDDAVKAFVADCMKQ
jgi:hypothetical protein